MAQPEDVRKLTVRDIQRGIERLRARIQALKEFDPAAVTVSGPGEVPELTALSDSIERTLENLFGEKTPAFRRFSDPSLARLEGPGSPVASHENWYRQLMRRKVSRSVALLERAIKTL